MFSIAAWRASARLGPKSVVWSEDADAVLASDVDVIVELVDDLDPPAPWARRTLEAHKHCHRQ